ncbi:unnamed protein product [Chrysoparadoxa australica]
MASIRRSVKLSKSSTSSSPPTQAKNSSTQRSTAASQKSTASRGPSPPPAAPLSASVLFQGPHTFRERTRSNALQDLLSTVQPRGGWRVMVLDERATRVFSAAVSMFDMMEAKVTVVENLVKARQPFPEMEAIYVLSPTPDSVERVRRDFQTAEGSLYAAVHLLFLSRVPKPAMAALQQNALLVSRIKTLREINIDFLPVEAQTFHLDLGQPHNGMSTALYSKLYRSLDEEVCHMIAGRLVTLCVTLKEFPHVRYSGASPRAERVAALFQDKMSAFISRAPHWEFQGQEATEGGGRATLLLVDRSDDAVSPLMHEFTYQCLVEDLLDPQEGRLQYSANTGGGTAKKEVVLNESDDLWVEYRHEHIAKVLTELGTRFKDLVKNHGAAAALVKGSGRNMSLEQMAAATRGLPEFQELTKKMSQHIHLSQQCSTKISEGDLLAAGTLEQTMALGVDDAGKSRNRADLRTGWTLDGEKVSGLLELVKNREASSETKIRLVAIFLLTQKDAKFVECENLYQAAGFSEADKKVCESLHSLGAEAGSHSKAAAVQEEPKKSKFKFKLGFSSSSKVPEDEQEFSHMRYTPPLKLTVQSLIDNSLSLNDFPSVLPLPEDASGGMQGGGGASKSIRKANSNQPGGGGMNVLKGPRVIVFGIGGICHSELRALHEVMKATQREVVAGGTSIISPKAYLAEIGHMA